MISTVTQLNIIETNNSVDGSDGDWSIIAGEAVLYIVNNKNGKRYSITPSQVNTPQEDN
tara:strand:- start:1981 stop:2157 length:177 start_codon:yes stop_codon:yes gene_type:complete